MIDADFLDMLPDVCSLILLGPKDVTGKPSLVSETTGVRCRWVDSVMVMNLRASATGAITAGVGETVSVAYLATAAPLSTGYSIRHDGKVKPIRAVETHEDEWGDVHHVKIICGQR